MKLRAWWLAIFLVLASAVPAGAGPYYIMLGSRVVATDNLPVFFLNSKDFVSASLLDELGFSAPLPTDGQDDPPPHYEPGEGTQAPSGAPIKDGESTVVSLIQEPPPESIPAIASGMKRYRVGGHVLDISLPGQELSARLDGRETDRGDLAVFQGSIYLSAEILGEIGLYLAYNSVEDLYQLVGLVYRIEFEDQRESLLIRALTPMHIEGVQTGDELVTLVVEGGFFPPMESQDFPGGKLISRLGFKSQPSLGRSFVFVRQPHRTGFKVVSDSLVGYSRVNFGNYLQVASYAMTSSGEISLNVQLGAACEARHEIIPDPWRIVVDFPGAVYEDATQKIQVGVGRVQAIRIGTPEKGMVRVVMDLQERADYRIMTKDGGARYFIQLLPPVQELASIGALRSRRTIMVDAGHGGSDPGAEGILPGVWEAPITLSISQKLAAELRSMGYSVLETRGSDKFVSLGARADYANTALPYLFVSVHANSIDYNSEMQGAMTFHHPASTIAPQLAEDVLQELVYTTGAVDKGVRQANFFVLRETVVPSILVETGFLTNGDECALLIDPAYQTRVARGIARGIDRYITAGY